MADASIWGGRRRWRNDLRTTDAGANWDAVASGTPRRLNAITFSDSQHGWIAGDVGTLLETNDAGASWSPVSIGTPNALLAVAQSGASVWATGAEGTAWRSQNGGSSFSPYNLKLDARADVNVVTCSRPTRCGSREAAASSATPPQWRRRRGRSSSIRMNHADHWIYGASAVARGRRTRRTRRGVQHRPLRRFWRLPDAAPRSYARGARRPSFVRRPGARQLLRPEPRLQKHDLLSARHKVPQPGQRRERLADRLAGVPARLQQVSTRSWSRPRIRTSGSCRDGARHPARLCLRTTDWGAPWTLGAGSARSGRRRKNLIEV